MGVKQRADLNAPSSAVSPAAPGADVLRDPLLDAAPPASPAVEAPADLPLVPLPSRFKPATFMQASQARGARPAALKAIDEQLARVDAAHDPSERFEHLRTLQVVLRDFVGRYGKDNARGAAAHDLKSWVDGAITLRAPLFGGNKDAGRKVGP